MLAQAPGICRKKLTVLNTFLLFIVLTFLSGCSKAVCSVGNIRITEKDLELRARVSEVYYPQSGRRYIALAQLIKGYLSLLILQSLDYKVDGAMLEKESERIDNNTKAPLVLKKIKDVYGNNKKAYLKTFIQIVYAERVLYNEIFLKSGSASRMDYDEWFWEKASKIPVNIYDRALRDELLKEVSWAKRLKFS